MSWGAASPIRPNRHSPAARCTEDIHNMDGAEGRGVTGIAFTAFFQCSPQSPCIPSNEFFANKSKHHKQTHEPTLILSHLSPLLASSFPGEQIFTKQKNPKPNKKNIQRLTYLFNNLRLEKRFDLNKMVPVMHYKTAFTLDLLLACNTLMNIPLQGVLRSAALAV